MVDRTPEIVTTLCGTKLLTLFPKVILGLWGSKTEEEYINYQSETTLNFDNTAAKFNMAATKRQAVLN
jgi:hypothetical protein